MDHEPERAGTSAAAHRMSGETVAPARGTRPSMASIRLLPAIALRRPRVLGATLGLLLFTFAAFGMLAVHNFASADIESAVRSSLEFSLLMCSCLSLSLSLYTHEEGMSKNNAILNFGFLFGLNNGLIDDKLYVPR